MFKEATGIYQTSRGAEQTKYTKCVKTVLSKIDFAISEQL